jgi:ABC-type nitrate/sulfonate/bicarbonate transport system permease component
MSRALDRLLNPFLLLALLGLWQAAVATGLLHNPAVPAPSAIITSLWHGLFGAGHILARAALATLFRLLLGYFIALAGGTILGLLAGRHDDLAAALNPLVALWIPLPAIVTIPVLSLWLGAGPTVIVLTVVFSAWIPLYLGALQGARSVATRQLWVARAHGAGPLAETWHVVVPSALVQMIPSLKVGMGYAWRAVIAAEIVVQKGHGIGVTIYAARQFFDVPVMYAGVAMIAVIGLALERLAFPAMERLTIRRWGLAA